METHQLRQFIRQTISPPLEVVEVVQVESHDIFGLLLLCKDRSGREMQLIPCFVGRTFPVIPIGQQGLALFGGVGSTDGYFLAGIPIQTVVPEHWSREEHLVDVPTDLRLRAGGQIKLEAEGMVSVLPDGKPAARRMDEIQVQLSGNQGYAELIALATALLATGLFLPSGSPPISPPAPVFVTLSGRITTGSPRVLIGGDDDE